MSRYYPLFLDISGKTCLIVGGGAVAERKARSLLEAGARVRIVSPMLTETLRSLAQQGQVESVLASYSPDRLEGAALVFAATNDRAVNARVVEDAKAARLPVNAADAPEDGDFIVPSVVRRGDLCIGISTGGNNPMLAARIADEMEARFGPEYARFLELLGRMRVTIKEKTEDASLRRTALARLLDGEAELRRHLREGDEAGAEALALVWIASALGL